MNFTIRELYSVMKYFFLIISIFIFGCQNSDSLVVTYNKNISDFYRLVENGYIRKSDNKKKYIFRFPKDIQICIYNDPPNAVSRVTLGKLFKLMFSEFNFGTHIYVRKLESCPKNTHIYFQLRDELNYYKSLDGEFTKVFKLQGIDTRIKNLVGRMGFGAIRIRRDKTVGFATVFQMTNHIGNKAVDTRVNELIIEELYQTIAMGRDVDVKEKPKSILNEVNFTYGGALDRWDDVDIEAFKGRANKNPVGLCGYDLWFLLTLSTFDERIIPYHKFRKKFESNFSKIKNQALKIEKNRAYKGLFDPRCSGKNTGINTKIGIQ